MLSAVASRRRTFRSSSELHLQPNPCSRRSGRSRSNGVEDVSDHRRVALALEEGTGADPCAVADAVVVGFEVTAIVVRGSTLEHRQQVDSVRAGIPVGVEAIQLQRLVADEGKPLQGDRFAHVVLGGGGDQASAGVPTDHGGVVRRRLIKAAPQSDLGKGAGIQQPGLPTAHEGDLASVAAQQFGRDPHPEASQAVGPSQPRMMDADVEPKIDVPGQATGPVGRSQCRARGDAPKRPVSGEGVMVVVRTEIRPDPPGRVSRSDPFRDANPCPGGRRPARGRCSSGLQRAGRRS
jgi:hypothetical protein